MTSKHVLLFRINQYY